MALLAPPAPLSAAEPAPQTSLSEISSEVMCPVCGTLLELAESPQALRQKAFVSRLVAEGKSKDEIKDALVTEYGTEVLALPQGSGFDLSAYLVPIVAFVIAVDRPGHRRAALAPGRQPRATARSPRRRAVPAPRTASGSTPTSPATTSDRAPNRARRRWRRGSRAGSRRSWARNSLPARPDRPLAETAARTASACAATASGSPWPTSSGGPTSTVRS